MLVRLSFPFSLPPPSTTNSSTILLSSTTACCALRDSRHNMLSSSGPPICPWPRTFVSPKSSCEGIRHAQTFLPSFARLAYDPVSSSYLLTLLLTLTLSSQTLIPAKTHKDRAEALINANCGRLIPYAGAGKPEQLHALYGFNCFGQGQSVLLEEDLIVAARPLAGLGPGDGASPPLCI
jgi:hypothetical protein